MEGSRCWVLILKRKTLTGRSFFVSHQLHATAEGQKEISMSRRRHSSPADRSRSHLEIYKDLRDRRNGKRHTWAEEGPGTEESSKKKDRSSMRFLLRQQAAGMRA